MNDLTLHQILVRVIVVALLTGVAHAGNTASDPSSTSSLFEPLAAYVRDRESEYGEIDLARRAQLEAISDFATDELAAGRIPRLVFVCTHNSRRSHLSQLWAAVGAEVHALPAMTYSGGTESTAFNARAVAAVERAGFAVEKTSADVNPVYPVRMGRTVSPITCFSKAYDHAPNPSANFAAVMVCSDADDACPIVPGAIARFAVPFIDPKVADGTPEEAATYDARCAQIAREMLFLMSRVRH